MIHLPTNVRLLVETKPFVDSDTRQLTEVTVIGHDDLHWICERGRGSRHYYPKSTVTDYCEV